jgi:phospholipid transport system transporter-binding protein
MNQSSAFSVNPSGLARVSGPLTLDTVAAIYGLAKAEAAQGRYFDDLDLDAVSNVDSSGLALLLEWQSTARHAGRRLHIRNAPADLLSLASLCEANDLLAIKGRNRNDPINEIPPLSDQDANK